jgi:hypothetical protein
MFTLVGWSQSQDTSNALTIVNAIADPHIYSQGTDIIPLPGFENIAATFAFGTTLTRAQLVSPTLRTFVNQEIQPIQNDLTVVGPVNVVRHFSSPLRVRPGEKIQAYVAENASGAERDYVLAVLSDGPLQPVTGDIHSLRITASTTLVANTWSNCVLTFDQTLPPGRYQIVGSRWRAAGIIAARFVLPGMYHRPGYVGRQQDYYWVNDEQRFGRMGVWGEFDYLQVPTLDVLSTSADTSEVGIVDLIKVG